MIATVFRPMFLPPLVSEAFGAPLIVKSTFLQFDLYSHDSRVRLSSAPAVLCRCRLQTKEAAETAETATTERPRGEDDEEVLREGRSQTLCETWRLWVERLLVTAAEECRRYVVERTMRLRVTLTRAGFAQTATTLQHSPTEMFVLSRLRVIRVHEERDAVEIWCDDNHMETPKMKEFLAEAAIVCELSQHYFFAQAGDIGFVVHYKKKQTVAALRKNLCAICGMAPSRMQLCVLGSDEVLSDDRATLASTSVRPGRCVRIEERSGV